MADPCCDQFGGEHEYGTRARANGSFIFAVEKKDKNKNSPLWFSLEISLQKR